ncbi:F5 [Symbiodinium sp. CCMP2592]|nr:F5 [Symbiodinium sp. CCMP2592]
MASGDDLPPAIRAKAEYGELLDLFIAAGGCWADCSLVQNSVSAENRLISGGQKYKRFKDIVAEEGEDHAKSLRDMKKEQQAKQGDLHPGVPFWYCHPDWPTSPDMELFLCFDEAKVNSSNATSTSTQQQTSMAIDGNLASDLRFAAPTLAVDPTGSGRALQPTQSMESLPDSMNPKGKGKNKGRSRKGDDEENPNPPKKTAKPNFTGKANAKVKNGRTTNTEAKFWLRKIQADKNQSEDGKRKVSKELADGYLSQITLYQGPVDIATDALDMKLIEGAKDEASLKPLMEALDAALEDFATALRPIKAIFATLLHSYSECT